MILNADTESCNICRVSSSAPIELSYSQFSGGLFILFCSVLFIHYTDEGLLWDGVCEHSQPGDEPLAPGTATVSEQR